MIRCIAFTASTIDITPKSDNLMDVEMEVTEAEFESMLGYFDEKDVVEHFGARQLLEHIDTEDIRAYLNEIGIKSEWEEI